MNNSAIQKLLAEGEGIRLEFKRCHDALNRVSDAYSGQNPQMQEADVFRTLIPLPEQITGKSSPKGSKKTEDRILALIRADRSISAEKMGAEIGISKRAVLKQINKLKQQQRLERVGAAKGGYWNVLDG